MLVIVADRGWRRSWYMRGGLVLVAAILVATIVHADSFDLSAHPLQIVYPLAYVVALPGATGSLL